MNKLYILYFFIFCGLCLLIYKYRNLIEGLDTSYNCNEVCGLLGQVNAKNCESLNGSFTCLNNDGQKNQISCKKGVGKCRM